MGICLLLFTVQLLSNHNTFWEIFSRDEIHNPTSAVGFRRTGSRDGAVVRALASHQCVPGLIVFHSASRGFSPGTPVIPSPQKPVFPNSNSILGMHGHF